MNKLKQQLSALVGFTILILFVGAIPIAAGLFARCIFWLLCLGWHLTGRFLHR